MRKALLIVSVAVFGLSFGCGGKDAKDKPAAAVDTAAVAPDTVADVPDTTAAGKTEASAPEVIDIDIDMVFVKGGTFLMGCTKEQGEDCKSDEKPAHKVTLTGFYICRYETTQLLWQSVMGSNPSYFKGNNLPVESVNWNDVQRFIQELNVKTDKKYRLPTEAEWEYVARGGSKSKGYKYSGGNNVDDVAWYGESVYDKKTHPVGTKRPNELAVYDMSGNVREWVNDFYEAEYYSSSEQTNPPGPLSSSYCERIGCVGLDFPGGSNKNYTDCYRRNCDVSIRVVRGGDILCSPEYLRVSVRDYCNQDYESGHPDLGFRLAHDQ